MTHDEIMEMDANELCEWLWQMGAIPPEVAEPILGVKGDYRGWNLPACAFAARDYIGNGVREWGEIGLLESTIEKISGFRAFYAQPIDCLRAAALVIAGREK